MSSNQRLVTLVGTNASGKSSLAIELCTRYSGQIVSADSRQVYRGFDLCSGKTPASERKGVPHHLIDLFDVEVEVSVADYQGLAYSAIDGVLKGGARPFLVGGSGLHVDSVAKGYEFTAVTPDANLRKALAGVELADLVEMLEELAPESVKRIDQANRQRVVRALELARAGVPLERAHIASPRYDVLWLGLTWPSDVLRERIERRLRLRLAGGMITEVEQALKMGVPYHRLRALGLEFRFIADFVRGDIVTETALFEKLSRAIWHFARRQMTWFRRNPAILWLDPLGDYLGQADAVVSSFLTRGDKSHDQT